MMNNEHSVELVKDEDRLLLNRIITPDGTELISYHRTDYKTYTDANGSTYMVDGGIAYLRRTICDEEYTEASIYMTDDHESNRKAFHWGTYGKDGMQPRKFVAVCDLDTDHIEAIVKTQKRMPAHIRKIMVSELAFRYGHSG